jgi:hypothetical protein
MTISTRILVVLLSGNVINNDDINLDPSLSSKGEELKQL